jgi:hypothetical protein
VFLRGWVNKGVFISGEGMGGPWLEFGSSALVLVPLIGVGFEWSWEVDEEEANEGAIWKWKWGSCFCGFVSSCIGN